MIKEYYAISEVTKIFKKLNISTDIEEIFNYARESLIQPLIYIDSIPVLVRGLGGIIVGKCRLSGYWNISGNIVAVLDGLLRTPSVSVPYVVKTYQLNGKHTHRIDCEPWLQQGEENCEQISMFHFSQTPVFCYSFMDDNPLQVSIKNIFISQNDLHFLKENLLKQEEDFFETHQEERLQEQREASLMQVIDEIIEIAKKEGFNIDKAQMPGTKSEFIALIQVRDKTFRYLSTVTIGDYFKRMKIKFKQGARKDSKSIVTLREILDRNME